MKLKCNKFYIIIVATLPKNKMQKAIWKILSCPEKLKYTNVCILLKNKFMPKISTYMTPHIKHNVIFIF